MRFFLVAFALLYFTIYFFKNKKWFSLQVSLFLLAKIVLSFFFVWLYTYYYVEKGDLFTYHSTTQELLVGIESDNYSLLDILFNNSGFDSSWNLKPRALLFSKIYLCFSFFVPSSVHWVSLLFSLVSFVLFLELYKYVSNHRLFNPKFLLIGFCLAPSVLFWTSSVTKETLCFPLFFICLAILYKVIRQNFDIKSVILFILCIVPLYFLRFFYVPFLAVFSFSYFMLRNYKKWYSWAVVFASLLLFFLFQSYLLPQLQFKHFFNVLFMSYTDVYEVSAKQSRFDLGFTDNSASTSIRAMIKSLKYVFFFGTEDWLKILSSLENALMLAGVSTFFLRKQAGIKFLFSLGLMMLVSAVLINTSTPNLGSLSRYRVVYWYPLAIMVVANIKGFLDSRKPLL